MKGVHRMDTPLPDDHNNEYGTIRIAPEVVEIISGLATMEVEGVASMSGGFAEGIAEWLGRKNLSRGVKVEIGDKDVMIDVSVIIRYGHSIPDTATAIQNRVKQAIESMTGLTVTKVHVHVHDVHFGNEHKGDEPQLEDAAESHES